MNESFSIESKEGVGKRYVIVAFTEEPRERFAKAAWPPHVTIVRPFISTEPLSSMMQRMKAVCARYAPVLVTGESREMFGPDQSVPVTTVTLVSDLESLQRELENVCGDKLEFTGPSFDSYRPHVSDTENKELGVGDRVTLSSVSIVEMEEGDRRVVETMRLGE
jgi:hypothetical protein